MIGQERNNTIMNERDLEQVPLVRFGIKRQSHFKVYRYWENLVRLD